MDWEVSNNKHIWYWMASLSNGWTAMVVDDSQAQYPTKPTFYRISAASKKEMREGKQTYDTLSEAKTAAWLFAAQLEKVEV